LNGTRSAKKALFFREKKMPVKVEAMADPAPPANSKQPGVMTSLLYNGSRFQGHQKSKGNCYDVEVVLLVLRENLAHFYRSEVSSSIIE
jgi:hypothetical protein